MKRDTYNSMSWENFLELITEYGFKLAFKLEYEINSRTEQEIIYYFKERGLILYAISYLGRFGRGNVYGELKKGFRQFNYENDYHVLSDCAYTLKGDRAIPFSKDISNNMIKVLDDLYETNMLSKKWKEQCFLYFINYKEEQEKPIDYKKISKNKILKCPEGMKKICKNIFE